MTVEPRWISKEALLLLHEQSLVTFGGESGLRDEGLLDSALARPRNTHAYHAESTLADLAASYAFGLAKNYAFLDGNKRTAFLSIDIFLATNGLKLVADQSDAIRTIFAGAASELDERGLSAWIHNDTGPR